MVVAGVEVVLVARYWNALCDLLTSPGHPLVSEVPQVKVVVHGIIVEFFLVDLILLVLESVVEPVQKIQHLDGLLEELIVDLHTLDDIQSEDVL